MQGLIKKDLEAPFMLLPMEDVVCGAGLTSTLSQYLANHGVERAMIITGNTLANKTDLVDRIEEYAGGRVAHVYSSSKQHVPRSSVLEAAQLAREINADGLISFGGGSPNDTAKAVAIALAEDIRDVGEFDRVRIKFQYPDQLEIPPVSGECPPIFAIPTTLSAGEFTHFAGITDEERQVKDLYIDKKLTAKTVFLDPELTLATPQWLWLSSGMRSVDHCIEALVSSTAHPFTDGLGAHALKMLTRFLRECHADPSDMTARLQAQVASWMSVCGLANVTLGLSHGIGHQLGARCGVPHGHTSCVMMPSTMRFNAEHTQERLRWVAELMGVDTSDMNDAEASAAAADAVLTLTKDLEQPWRLRDVGVSRDDFQAIAQDALQDLIVATNPRPIGSTDEIIALLESAY